MKIALVMKDYDESRGGAERYFVALANRIARSQSFPKEGQRAEDISLDLIVNRFNGTLPPGIGIRRVKAITWSSTLKPLSFNRKVQRLLKREDYDLVYGLTQIYPQDIYRVGGGLEHSWREIRYPRSWLRMVNSILPRISIRLYMENQIFKRENFRKLVTNSFLCKYQILERYNVSPEDIAVVYNGVDKERFSPQVKRLHRARVRNDLGISLTDKVILFVSHNWRRKGLKELLQALASIKRHRSIADIRLLIVGRGRKRPYIRLAKKLGVSSEVIFVGVTQEPWRYYGAADMLILPTYYDPFANVCLEALACGVPVITTGMNGARELIVEGKNGYVIENPQGITGLSGYIERVFFKDNLEKMQKEAVESVKDFTLERTVNETLRVFKDVLDRNRSSSRDENLILVNNGYRGILEQVDLLEFDKIMEYSSGRLYKKNALRSVVKIELNGKRFFLKRHFKKAPVSWAIREWQNIYRLKALGISTMEPVAVGQSRDRKSSFIITESLEPALRLEDFVPERFSRGLGRESILQKRALIHDLAELTRNLHRNKLFHKDFYSGHIFIKKEDPKSRLYIIDLQRLCRHALFLRRWRVKDLASLNFSFPPGIVTNTDRTRFLKWYLGTESFNKRHRLLVYSIIGKTERIARHTRKMLARRSLSHSEE